jgi:predicted RNA-binding Zn ribbon-like protein
MDEPNARWALESDRPVLELLNSRRPDGVDLLADPEWAAAALRRWRLDPGRPPSRSGLEALAELRALLRDLTAAAAERRLDRSELAALNAVLSLAPVRARVEAGDGGGYVVEMTPVGGRWEDVAVRELAGAFASMLRRSHPLRLKLCADDACRIAFYDDTRSRTRRWHDPATCGNRARVRRHRERARKAPPG